MTMVIGFIAALIIALSGYFIYDSQKTASATPTETSRTLNSPASAPALTTVNRSGQNLSKMPADILAMTNLQQLNLSNNALTGALPAEIRLLQNLQVLNISNNKMTGLPAEVGQLSKLRILNASNNQLTGIPHELGNLQNLEILDLSGNDISGQDLQVIREKLPASTEIIL